MEVEEAVSLEELSKRCGCCFKSLENILIKEISKDIERKFYELVQYEFISKKFSSSICYECDEKLSRFEIFKLELQENQKNLENTLTIYKNQELTEVKIEDEDTYIEEYLDPEFNEEETNHGTIENTTGTSRQICPICAKYFSAGSLDVHIKRKHSDECNFQCDNCPQKFNVKRDLISHLAKHTEVEFRRKFQCNYCSKIYTKNSTLQHHIKMHHQEDVEEFKCECGARFKTKIRLNYHKKFTHEKGDYQCHQCNRTYPSMHNLKIHISHFHSTKSPCIYCGKLVAPGTFMRRHMKTHEPAEHECEVCSKAFTMRETMLEHQRTVHQMGETHYCENCGKSFGSKKVLKRHIERSHKTSEKVQCQVPGCSYAGNRKDNLINHVRSHKDVEERYKLDIIAKIKSIKNLSW